ncbi:MAG TPA: CvpA family protein [Bryobacteraceae bacterium]|jgi:membrane protein required for colicin V production|nr:CvpA family protein [Bryobacteraceae bacterium]
MPYMPFNWFDIVLVLILFWSAAAGLRAGFARVVIGLIATVLGLIAGFWFYRILAVQLMPWLKTPVVADVLGFLAIFIGVIILGALLAALFSRLFRWFGLSWFNHLLGGFAGFLRGALIIAAMVGVLVAYSPSPTPSFLEGSRLMPYVSELSSWLVDLAPRELKDAFTEQMDNLKQLWHHAQPHASQEV